MTNFLYSYQHFPLYLKPAFEVGFFSISWYSIMYLIVFGMVYLLLKHRIKAGECDIKAQGQKRKTQNESLKLKIGGNTRPKTINIEYLTDFLIYAFIGLLIGARVGEVLFYNFSHYWNNPLAVISPFDPVTHEFIGIYGMSYHGGLIGILIAAFVFTKKYGIDFWDFSDFVIPAIPAGYFFGRIGNFINNELYGRVTEKSWGMYFRDDFLNLRHPSQLYEACLEGVVLFVILWSVRNKKMFQGCLFPVYLVGYAIFRFFCEFFREPEGKLYFSGLFTLGQIFSLIMIFLAIDIIIFKKSKKEV